MPNDTAVPVDVAEEQIHAEESESTAEATKAAGEESLDPQATPKEGDSENETPEQKKKRLGGWQRKIVKAEQERDFWREEALRTRSTKPADAPTEKAAEAPQKPKQENFKTWEEYEDAKDKYYGELATHQAKLAVAEAQKASEQKTVQQTAETRWRAQEAKSSGTHEDYRPVAEEAMKALHQHNNPAVQAVCGAITESEVGTEVLYHLGQNPKEVERLAKLSPYRAVIELGKIEDSFIASNSPEAEPEEEEPPAKPISKAPKPPSLVRKSSSPPDDGDLRDDLSPEEWKKRFLKKTEKR